MSAFTVCVPATTANLGPGFDCLGLALDIINEYTFSLEGEGLEIMVEGFSNQPLPHTEENLIWRSLSTYYEKYNEELPTGLRIDCHNRFPMGSGLGSSCTAVIAGLAAAAHILGKGFDREEILSMAYKLEGHADNAAGALFGGLSIVSSDGGDLIIRKVPCAEWKTAVVVPLIDLPTRVMREALPTQISMQDAVFNIGHTALTLAAFEDGDADMLERVMRDRLHQPYRLGLIPGAAEAIQAAMSKRAAAAVISGAGPGLIAFTMSDPEPIMNAMLEAVNTEGVEAVGLTAGICQEGAFIKTGAE